MLASFLTAIMLLAFGLVLLFWLAAQLIGPLKILLRRQKGNVKVNKAAKKLSKIDALISASKFQEALKQLRRSVSLDVAYSLKEIEAAKDHHQNVLSRCLVISEELHSRSKNIGEVEKLLLERAELQCLLLKASESYKNLLSRRKEAGKEVPAWSKSEFEQRIKEIKKELLKNQDALVPELDRFFSDLAKPDVDQIVYH